MSSPVPGTGTLPISSLIQQPGSGTSLPPAGSNSQLNAADFLTMLTTELQNQDPTKPVDATQSVAQLAQFSALQSQEQLTASFQAFQSNFGVLQTASLIGQQVTCETTTAGSSTVTGTVASVSVQNGVPYFTMNGSNGQPLTDSSGNPLLFSASQIVGIGK
ncbi:MAG: flagellar hook assembly protein FlgD [Vulcanimicrobiaceae bacterium]